MTQRERDTSILRSVRAALGSMMKGTTDGELLGRFVSQGEEAAFELLVHRHMATVLRTCRVILRDYHSAEDAAQAVFLALAKSASSIKDGNTLVGWLHSTARRIAMRSAKLNRARKTFPAELENVPGENADDAEMLAVLHEELAKLPERYRLPLLLCYFEGLTFTDVGRRLGWPPGTVSVRIARGKEFLSLRMARRGMTVAAAVAVLSSATEPAVSAGFMESTVRAALHFAILSEPIGGASRASWELARAHMRGVIARKVQTALCLSSLVIVIGGAALIDFSKPEPVAEVFSVNSPVVVAKPKEIDEKVIEAYEELGAGFGFCRKNHVGSYAFRSDVTRKTKATEKMANYDPQFLEMESDLKSLPVFKFIGPTRFSELPKVDVPFGLVFQNVVLNKENLQTIGAQKELRFLDLGDSQFSRKDFKELAPLKKIRVLNLWRSGIDDDSIDIIADFPELTSLTVSDTHVSLKCISKLSKCKALRDLHLGGQAISDEHLKELVKFEQLEHLSVDPSQLGDKEMRRFREFKKLKSLQLSSPMYTTWPRLTIEGWKELAKCKGMTRLAVNNAKVDDAVLRSLTPLKGLVILDLSGGKITDGGLKDLQEFPLLDTLGLGNCQITDDGLKTLEDVKSLSTLNLNQTAITEEGLKRLKRWKNLKQLSLIGVEKFQLDQTAITEFEQVRRDCRVHY